ncbi:MAG: phosphate acyltransferase PlsX [Lachnospiraceae bacterium]|jgi:glycerol-3-phosphate acyltransferase PlsX|nr:phosphate acyltransferase PlsX [Lachnospiraceae bacterium]
MTILLDAMGGDNAPDASIKGAVKAAKEIKSQIILVGKEEVIKSKLKEFYGTEDISKISPNLKIENATEEIVMEDIPTQAIKQKKDSSMVVGFRMLKEGKADAFVSAGNSGALLTGATLLVGRIKGIDRPALAPMLPAYKKSFMLIDAGSNTNCKVENLVQFAQMANIYLKNTYGIKEPKIGLLNIGTEEHKGNELMKETYKALTEKSEELGIKFIGNIEGREIFAGEIDAVVTDGFTGNVFLKTVEGMGKLIKRTLTENLKKNIFRKIGAIGALPSIKALSKAMDYKEYGGALFLGVKKPVIKAHGSSDERLFYTTLKQAENFAKSTAIEELEKEISKM